MFSAALTSLTSSSGCTPVNQAECAYVDGDARVNHIKCASVNAHACQLSVMFCANRKEKLTSYDRESSFACQHVNAET